MKIKKFNENKIPKNEIEKILDDYSKLVHFLRPIAIWKYYEIAEIAEQDEDYETESGDIPTTDVQEEYLVIENIHNTTSGLFFSLASYTKYQSIEYVFEIFVTYKEIDNFEIIVTSKKYNM